jgi:Domain of unknown function (DUF4192)
MTQRAPDEVRAAPASLLGFASWLSGHGAMAWCALDQVPRDKPCALANLVAAAVQTGMRPREWEAAKCRPADRGVDLISGFAAHGSGTERAPVRPADGL